MKSLSVQDVVMNEPAKANIERLEAALDSPQPDAIRALAVELRDSGLSQAELYGVFDAVRLRHQDDADERKYDAVLDVMDLIVGWCPRAPPPTTFLPLPPPPKRRFFTQTRGRSRTSLRRRHSLTCRRADVEV